VLSSGEYAQNSRTAPGTSDPGEDVSVAALAQVTWRKSSWSAYNGNCVEAASLPSGAIAVRDTKDAGCGPVLMLGYVAWGSFVNVH
jgi:hypothetical protein